MVFKRSLDFNEITGLFYKLKAETPDYPADLLAARKAAFLKQAVNIKIDGRGQGGKGGQQGGSSGSGAALGGGAAGLGTLWQALIGVSIVAAMFLAAYAYREQITEILQGNEVAALEDVSQPSIVSSPLAPGTVTAVPSSLAPALAVPPIEILPTGTPGASVDNTDLNGAEVVVGTPDAEISAEKTKSNSGLHLGQTPGTPAAPGQGNPGNLNQPDKPDKPTKPDKPVKPPKPEKTKKPKNQ
jgi:hypothetical protein